MRLAERAHELAIATESVFVLHIDVETGRYWVTGKQAGDMAPRQGLEGQLPEEVAITDVDLSEESRTVENVITIEFSPEGWRDPVLVTITSSDGQTVSLAIDEWFGEMDLIGDRPDG